MNYFFKLTLLSLSVYFSTNKKFTLPDQDCKINSHIVAVDNTNAETYDLLLSFSTEAKCTFLCLLKNAGNSTSELVDSYYFYGRWYYFFKFLKLNSFINYLYQCGSSTNDMNDFSITFPKNKETKILTFGDWSQSTEGTKTYSFLTKTIVSSNYDALLTLGDYAYNLASKFKSWDKGNQFMDWIMPISSPLPFMMNPGNHEYINGSFEQFTKRFFMPNKAFSDNLYYSFDINNVHFISVPSEYGLNKYAKIFDLEKFKKWFEGDTAANKKQWTVVYMHRPLYCSLLSKSRCSKDSDELIRFFEDLFFHAKVDIVVAGHVHKYERMFPIYNNFIDIDSISADQNTYTNPKYPVHIICGSAGNREGSPLLHITSKFVKYITNDTGVCEIEFKEQSMKIKFINTENQIKDSLEIIKLHKY